MRDADYHERRLLGSDETEEMRIDCTKACRTRAWQWEAWAVETEIMLERK